MTLPADAGIAPPVRAETDIPDNGDQSSAESATEFDDSRSLVDDVRALIDDGRTYLEAEFGFQKTRAAFVADRAKSTVVLGAIAALLAFLGLIGLTVGMVIALTPYLTAWGASALVVALLFVAAALAGRAAARKWNGLMRAISGEQEDIP